MANNNINDNKYDRIRYYGTNGNETWGDGGAMETDKQHRRQDYGERLENRPSRRTNTGRAGKDGTDIEGVREKEPFMIRISILWLKVRRRFFYATATLSIVALSLSAFGTGAGSTATDNEAAITLEQKGDATDTVNVAIRRGVNADTLGY